MHISGTIDNFERRLHQLPISASDLLDFKAEGLAFNAVPLYYINKWNREFNKKSWIVRKYGEQPFGGGFSSSSSSSSSSIDNNGDLTFALTFENDPLEFEGELITYSS